jgi:hypothetical protein
VAEPYKIDHPLFGIVERTAPGEYGDLIDLKPVTLRGAEIPTTLYYTSSSMAALSQQSLDPFAKLAQRIVTHQVALLLAGYRMPKDSDVIVTHFQHRKVGLT